MHTISKKKIINVFVSLLVLVLILGAVGVYKFNVLNNDIYIHGKSLTAKDEKLFLGAWVTPVSEEESKEQGFILNSDKTANSINTTALKYQSWKIVGDELILDVENAVGLINKEIYTIDMIGKRLLYLKKEEMEVIYKKL